MNISFVNHYRCEIEILKTTDTEPDLKLYQIVENQINSDVTNTIIKKVVRQGLKIGENILRPIEVIIDKPPK